MLNQSQSPRGVTVLLKNDHWYLPDMFAMKTKTKTLISCVWSKKNKPHFVSHKQHSAPLFLYSVNLRN